MLEIFNAEQTTTRNGTTDENGQIKVKIDGQPTTVSNKPHIIISSDDEQTITNKKISSLDAITQTSSDEDPELDQLIREAKARQELKTTKHNMPEVNGPGQNAANDAKTKDTPGQNAAHDAKTKDTPSQNSANDAKTKDTSSQNAANTTVTAYPGYARTATAYAKRTGLTQTRIPPEASPDHSEITDTALSENDMKRINKKIKMYEEIFAKNRQRTTQTKTTTNKNPAFYNHGQKLKKQRDRKRYTPPRIYDYRKKLKITLSLEN